MKDITLWEEKNSTEPTTKLENNPTFAQNDGIKEINKKFVKNVCENIGNKNGYHEPKNYINEKFGSFTITNQFLGKNNKTYVNCICDCGTSHIKLLSPLKTGNVKSCKKCQNRGNGCKKPYGEASFNSLYSQYKNNAKNGGCGTPNKEFTLSKEEARILFKGNCFYCGTPPNRSYKPTKKHNGEFICNGIDRKDNSKGYTIDNCVSCCSFCNYTKNDTSFDKFISWIRQVYDTTKDVKIT